MAYELKENNPFYGDKGTLISDHVYHRLPSKHQKLFILKSNDRNFDDFKCDISGIDKYNNLRMNSYCYSNEDVNQRYIDPDLQSYDDDDDDEEEDNNYYFDDDENEVLLEPDGPVDILPF